VGSSLSNRAIVSQKVPKVERNPKFTAKPIICID
jgi:hypothetical protein